MHHFVATLFMCVCMRSRVISREELEASLRKRSEDRGGCFRGCTGLFVWCLVMYVRTPTTPPPVLLRYFNLCCAPQLMHHLSLLLCSVMVSHFCVTRSTILIGGTRENTCTCHSSALNAVIHVK